MKKIIIFIVAVFVLPACSDLLEENNKSRAVSDYFNTREGFEDAVKGAYSYLRSYYATERGMTLSVFGTDEYTNGSDGGFKFINQYSSQFDARTSLLRELWVDFYRGINTANTAIDRAPLVSGMDETLKNVRVAEARFLRAHYYFILVQMFGPVHLTLNETTSSSSAAYRTPVNEVYDAIVDDLDFAIANLPASQGQWGRATMPAAKHLMARVRLTRATMDPTVDPQQEYQAAADLARDVIDNYTFSLLADYARVFDQGAGEINSEVIWSVQYTNDPLTNGEGNNAHLFFLMEYDVQPGMTRDVANGRPWKRFKPTNFALGLWDREIDSRYKKNFKETFFTNKPGTYKINGRDVVLNAGDTAIWIPGYEIPADKIASKNYQVLTPSKYTEKLYPTLTKFLDPLRPDVSAAQGSRDFLAFRLAETHLIAAEALFYLGDSEGAAQHINMVRRRAAWPGKEMEMEITAADVSIDFILDERARELFGEQLRWFDLVRTGKLVERVQLYNPQGKDNIRDFHVLRPIPQDQIDRTVNTDNASFEQNPGY